MSNVTLQAVGALVQRGGTFMRTGSPFLLLALLAACAPIPEPGEVGPDGSDDTESHEGITAMHAGNPALLAMHSGSFFDTDVDGSPTDTGDTAVDTGTGTDTGECISGTPAPTGPGLLTAANYAVLGGSTVTSIGATVLNGDLGLSPGSAIVGFPPGLVVGTTHTSDADAIQAQVDHTAAYVDAAARDGATPVAEDIGGMSLVPGVYSASSSLQIDSANLILDGGGDPNATWIFQIETTLLIASGVDVVLAGCADAANVYWQVGTSATIGTGSDFVGTIMADQSITVGSGATVDGRLLARIGAVTMDTNLVSGR